MYCPSCGTESTGLKYCNRCGANVAALVTPPEIIQINLTKPAVLIGIIMMLLTLGGFALLMVGARMLASVMQGSDPLMGLIIMGMLVIMIIDIILARQLTKLINAALTGSSQRTFAALVHRRSCHIQLNNSCRPAVSPKTRQGFLRAVIEELQKSRRHQRALSNWKS
jgi:hypothetical protein